MIWRTALDSRIGIFHAANRRSHSLNLDFADLFKSVITDRIIFALINRRQLQTDDFVINKDSSVYLSEKGKKVFIQAFYEKMESKLTVNHLRCSYQQLIENEIRAYQKHLLVSITDVMGTFRLLFYHAWDGRIDVYHFIL